MKLKKNIFGKSSCNKIMPKIIPILTYHSISSDNSKVSITIQTFEKQIKYFKENGYNSINFNQLNSNINKPIIITFDDGYKDNLINALPILKKYDFTATIFIISNFIGKKNFWDRNQQNFSNKEHLSTADINEWITNGMNIGSHSHNHLDLTQLNISDLSDELIMSKKSLENITQKKIDIFCYPFGKINKTVYQNVKNLYEKAVTTNRSRYNLLIHDTHLMPRIDMGKNYNKIKLFLKLNTIYEDIKFNKNEISM
jgi:peptidoglycan/xylan/chitin deacetylase (PgdA/CDA1 family)|tara:strand:+ start:277 stop:1041 length:765 start_codon:yes stop_codon:yes gene_type:complete